MQSEQEATSELAWVLFYFEPNRCRSAGSSTHHGHVKMK
jgi:hypothetical protein